MNWVKIIILYVIVIFRRSFILVYIFKDFLMIIFGFSVVCKFFFFGG